MASAYNLLMLIMLIVVSLSQFAHAQDSVFDSLTGLVDLMNTERELIQKTRMMILGNQQRLQNVKT